MSSDKDTSYHVVISPDCRYEECKKHHAAVIAKGADYCGHLNLRGKTQALGFAPIPEADQQANIDGETTFVATEETE